MPIIGHRQRAVSLERNLDKARMARHGLVHGVVDHLGKEVMHSLLVRAADIHAWPAADGLKPFQHLDVGRRIALAWLLHRQPADIRFPARGPVSVEKVLCRRRVLLVHIRSYCSVPGRDESLAKFKVYRLQAFPILARG
jgi:hypothetical protein